VQFYVQLAKYKITALKVVPGNFAPNRTSPPLLVHCGPHFTILGRLLLESILA
jgi:hypothetical protein